MTTHPHRATFGAKVRELREARGWTQKDLAQRLGMSNGAIAGWEQGGTAKEPVVVRLEDLFELEPGTLGSILGYAPPPEVPLPEDAIEADATIPPEHKRTLLAHLAEVRRIVAEYER